jgi:GNAT superfamily N-acetyltransferase
VAASDHLSEYQFSSQVKTSKKSPNSVSGLVKAKKGNRIVGHLAWVGTKNSQVSELNGATVHSIHVQEPHRRKGIATALVKTANKDVNEHGIKLEPSMNRSAEGESLYKSLTSPKS